MRDALHSCWSMLRIAWQHSKIKITLAIVLTLAAGLAWPLVALALKAATNAAVAGDIAGATVAGVLAGLGAIGVLMLRHFAFVSYVEITEVAVITLEAEIMTLANGSARLAGAVIRDTLAKGGNAYRPGDILFLPMSETIQNGSEMELRSITVLPAGPSCGTADFNADGDIGTDADIEAFFRVLAGGQC